MDLRKLRPRHLADPAAWRRAAHSVRDLARPALETAMEGGVQTLYFPQPDCPPPGRPLRILFAAPRFDYGDPRRGLGIEENYFGHALVAMGHQVVRFDTLGLLRRGGRAAMNRQLVEAVDRHRPDLVMTIMFKDELLPEVVAGLTRETGGRTVNWFCDDQWRFDSYSRAWAPNFGWVVTTSREAFHRYASEGLSSPVLSQWACNHFLYRPMPVPLECDVAFVGQPHGDRPQIISALRRAGIRVVTRGFGWPEGRITQSEMIRLFSASRISLNLSNASAQGAEQVKGRDFEVPGCRGFLVTRRSPEIAEFYEPGREIETYSDVDELVSVIRRYLADEDGRRRLAQAGYERTLKDHTMASRLNAILTHVTENPPGRPVDLTPRRARRGAPDRPRVGPAGKRSS